MKITDLDLVKRVGVIAGVFSVFLAIRTLVAPPAAIEGKTAEGLKAYLCRTDWWDHSFTTREYSRAHSLIYDTFVANFFLRSLSSMNDEGGFHTRNIVPL